MADTGWGACPVCGRNDGYQNIGNHHFFSCKKHRTTWCPASNRFERSRIETREWWKEAWEELKYYRTVDPSRKNSIGTPLGEQTTFAELMPRPGERGKRPSGGYPTIW